jgi:D-amino-acid dehydrogenase
LTAIVKKNYDIIIVGGGVVGASAAYFISARGSSVLLLEKASNGEGCTHASAGLIVPSCYDPVTNPANIIEGIRSLTDPYSPVKIRPHLDPSWIRWMRRFIHSSLSKKRFLHALNILLELNCQSEILHNELAEIGGDKYAYTAQGRLNVYRTKKGLDRGIAEAEDAKDRGFSCKVIGPPKIGEFEPWLCNNIVGGIYYSGDSHVSPGALAQWLIMQAESRGVHVITNARVFGFRRSGPRVLSVCSSQGEFGAGHVILAAGAWLDKLAQMLNQKLPIMGAKGYCLTIPRLSYMPRRPLLLDDDHIAIIPYKGNLRLTSSWELCGIDNKIQKESVDRILISVQQYTTYLDSVQPAEVRLGLRPTSADGLPIIGRLPYSKNVWVAGGHGQEGITQGPLAGRQIASIINGESLGALEDALSPSRFFR